MSFHLRVQKTVFWAGLLLMAAAAALVGFAYSYVTDSATLAAVIRDEAPRFLPGSTLNVGRVQVRPLIGQVILSQMVLWQKVDDRPFTAAKIPWVSVKHDLQALVQGRFEPREVVVAQPTLRVRRRND